MKKIYSFLIFMSLAAFYTLSAQYSGEQNSFDRIVISDGIFVQIEIGPEFNITIKNNKIDCIRQIIENNTLTIEKSGGSDCRDDILVAISCPSVAGIEVSNKAELTFKEIFKGDSLDVTIKSRGKVYLELDNAKLNAHIGEGGILNARGTTKIVSVNVITSGIFSAYDLKITDAKIRCTSGGMAKVCVSDSLKAKTIGNSYIGFKCDPENKMFDTTSGGKIESVSP